MHADPAIHAFEPCFGLAETAHSNLTSLAPVHWLTQHHFDAIGAAMLLFAPTRRLLRHAGLPIEDKDPSKLECSEPRWLALTALLATDELRAPERLFAARCFLYCGFHDAADTVLIPLRCARPSEVILAYRWISHLTALCRTPRTASPAPVADACGTTANGPLRLQVSMTIAGSFLRLGALRDGDAWLDRAERAFQGLEHNLDPEQIGRAHV